MLELKVIGGILLFFILKSIIEGQIDRYKSYRIGSKCLKDIKYILPKVEENYRVYRKYLSQNWHRKPIEKKLTVIRSSTVWNAYSNLSTLRTLNEKLDFKIKTINEVTDFVSLKSKLEHTKPLLNNYQFSYVDGMFKKLITRFENYDNGDDFYFIEVEYKTIDTMLQRYNDDYLKPITQYSSYKMTPSDLAIISKQGIENNYDFENDF